MDTPLGKYYNSQNKLDYLCLPDSRFRGNDGHFLHLWMKKRSNKLSLKNLCFRGDDSYGWNPLA